MSDPYYFMPSIDDVIPEIPEAGTLSRTVYEDENIKIVVFGMDEGQFLSEHTSSYPAIIQFMEGEGEMTLGDDRVSVSPGSMVYMQPGLKHSLKATTKLKMTLSLARVKR